MLFNSPEFVFLFLPIAVTAYYSLRGQFGLNVGLFSIVLSSILYYAWWNATYAALLVVWTFINAFVASLMLSHKIGKSKNLILVLGIMINLAVLGYFKYSLFFTENIGAILGLQFTVAKVILPIGISFFTFQKIAFLVDAWRGEVKSFNLLHYLFFVTFFPQLIAGPIVHYRELAPQLDQVKWRKTATDIAIGVSMFSIGLFKKTVLADTSATFSDSIFALAKAGQTLDAVSVWTAALAYAFQLYFDFSGYSDMALGCARMFGIALPLNFNSPYKAMSIVDFWRRWHITLSRFFRDYLYFPLGGGKAGSFRRHLNLLVVMTLAGFWHGAAWNFLLWGAMHGGLLVINHLWRAFFALSFDSHDSLPGVLSRIIYGLLCRSVTFACIVLTWIPFRAESLPSALDMMATAVGLGTHSALVWPDLPTAAWILAMLAVCNFLPNTCELFLKHDGALIERGTGFNRGNTRLSWQPTVIWSVYCGMLFVVVALTYSRLSPFIYYQF